MMYQVFGAVLILAILFSMMLIYHTFAAAFKAYHPITRALMMLLIAFGAAFLTYGSVLFFLHPR